MTFNWGHKLILVFVAFAGLMAFLAYKSFHTNYDLVSKEYYKDELVYQQVIDGTNKANALSAKVILKQEANNIVLQLPAEMRSKNITGSILFYCPANAANDKKIELRTNEDASQLINAGLFASATYTAKISWRCNDQFYYSEQDIMIYNK